MRYTKLPMWVALAGLLLVPLAAWAAPEEAGKVGTADKQPPAKGFFDVQAIYTPPEATFNSRPQGGPFGNPLLGSGWQGGSFTKPANSSTDTNSYYPTTQYNPAAQYQQLQQQMLLQQVYTSWQNSRRPQGSGVWLPGMGSTSQGDLCLPTAHIAMQTAQMFGVGGQRGNPNLRNCFAEGTQVQLADASRRIEEIAVGQRVSSLSATQTEIAPLAWRRLELQIAHRDGSLAKVILLRPLEWLEENQVQVGGKLALTLPGCGFEGQAEVLAVSACPAIQSGSGDVVTATIRHEAARLVDLHVVGMADPIGTTANHRFWSTDRQEFVRADELRPGEQLRGLQGDWKVSRVEPRPGVSAVCNLEVQGSQAFHVSPLGILVQDAGSIRAAR
jgi:hypothetical protein